MLGRAGQGNVMGQQPGGNWKGKGKGKRKEKGKGKRKGKGKGKEQRVVAPELPHDSQ